MLFFLNDSAILQTLQYLQSTRIRLSVETYLLIILRLLVGGPQFEFLMRWLLVY